MFAGIDIACERHMLARLDDQGAPIGKPMPITEDRAGYDTLLDLDLTRSCGVLADLGGYGSAMVISPAVS